jgi:hypothetical protein
MPGGGGAKLHCPLLRIVELINLFLVGGRWLYVGIQVVGIYPIPKLVSKMIMGFRLPTMN